MSKSLSKLTFEESFILVYRIIVKCSIIQTNSFSMDFIWGDLEWAWITHQGKCATSQIDWSFQIWPKVDWILWICLEHVIRYWQVIYRICRHNHEVNKIRHLVNVIDAAWVPGARDVIYFFCLKRGTWIFLDDVHVDMEVCASDWWAAEGPKPI